MKLYTLIVIILLFINHVKSIENETLVWSDEFNGKHIDESKWVIADNCPGNFILY